MSWRVISIATLFAFAIWVPMLSVPPMEDILIEKLSLSHAQTSLLYGAPILMMAIVAIPAGIVADRIGIRAAGIGSIIIVAGNLLRGIATDYNLLLIFTLIYGIGLGWSFPNLPKLVAHCVPPKRAYSAMGILSAGVLVSGGLSLAITLPFIYPVTHTYQGVFLIWSIPAVLASALWWIFIKEPPCVEEEISIKNDIHIIWQVLKHRNLWLLSIIFLMHNFFFYAWAGWATLFLTGEGATDQLAAVITSVTLWTGIPTVLLVTNLYNRPDRRKFLIWLPSAMLAIAAVIAPFVPYEESWLLMVLVGIATTTRFTTILTMPIEMMPKGQTGTASGLVMSIGYAGALIGPFVSGIILDATGSFQLVFHILIGISISTALVTLALPAVTVRKASSTDSSSD